MIHLCIQLYAKIEMIIIIINVSECLYCRMGSERLAGWLIEYTAVRGSERARPRRVASPAPPAPQWPVARGLSRVSDSRVPRARLFVYRQRSERRAFLFLVFAGIVCFSDFAIIFGILTL